MELSSLSPAYASGLGPVATVYLDTSRRTHDAAHMIEVRWRTARQSLADAGADTATLDALDGLVEGDGGPPGPHGLVAVAGEGQVRFTAALPAPPRRPIARWAPLPHLMPYVAQSDEYLPYVLVAVDRTGADIAVGGWTELPEDLASVQVEGSTGPVIRRTSPGGWSQRRFQQRAEDSWEATATRVADVVWRLAVRTRAQLVAVTGDVRAVQLLLDELADSPLRGALVAGSATLGSATRGGPASPRVVHLEHGGRGAGVDQDALVTELHAQLASVRAERDLAAIEEFAQERGQGDRAVEGLSATVAALQAGQVETLLVVDDPSADGELWVGPQPTDLALQPNTLPTATPAAPAGLAGSTTSGEGGPIVRDRVDAALVRAAWGTGAFLRTLAPGALEVTDGVAAVLRYAPGPVSGS